MSKLLQQFTKLFKQESTLDKFLSSKNIKTHADVEYWSKYYEYKGF